MPLEDLFDEPARPPDGEQQMLYERYGITGNPFPSAGQTSGHPRMPTPADRELDGAIKAFVRESKSSVIAVTASQGIGKTNLLTTYKAALDDKLAGRGLFIVRYVADPEPSLDPLVRSIFETLGEDHVRDIVERFHGLPSAERKKYLDRIPSVDVRNMLQCLTQEPPPANLDEYITAAHEWLMGLPVRKVHRELLGIQYRLDTIESKTRALHDVLFLSADLEIFHGLFLLLDELEKQSLSLGKTGVLRYLSSLRALIDALPQYLFLVLALTTDALERYREMLPALRGRLAHEVRLYPLRSEDEAEQLYLFYLNHAKDIAKSGARTGWREGTASVVTAAQARALYVDLRKQSTIEGVRQRELLNELHGMASQALHKVGA